MGFCAFCGFHGVLTREDANPRWLSRFINQHLPPEGRWEATEIHFGGDQPYSERTRTGVGGASIHKPVVVCPQCNNRWMSGLEQQVRRVLQPLVLGTPTRLSQQDIAVLASWATKTALVYELVQPHKDGPTASAGDRRWFAEHRAPLPDSRVWLGHYLGDMTVVVRRNTLFLFDLDDPLRTPEPHGVVTALIYGQVFLRVEIVRSRPTYPYSFAVLQGPHTLPLHPPEGPLDWPPAAVIDNSNLDEFTAIHR